MSAASDRKDALSAARDIKQDGAPVLFREVTEGGYNLETEQRDIVTKDYPTFGVWNAPSMREITSGGLLQVGDSSILIAAAMVSGEFIPAPDITDRIVETNGKEWDILSIVPVKPGIVPIVYTIYVRDPGNGGVAV